MNRFRARRKAKAEADAKTQAEAYTQAPALPVQTLSRIQTLVRPDTPSSVASRSFTMRRKRSLSPVRKLIPAPQPERQPEPELDLSTVLPDTRDFRTSLMMPKLSARFSMLREQDDPATKIGKANDDSVLAPKRSSRLNLFTNNTLTDINEVASIHGSIRHTASRDQDPTLAAVSAARVEGDSVMNRPKHREGNTLFGHRQNLYRFPTASKGHAGARNAEAEPAATARNTLYDGDVSVTAPLQSHEAQLGEQQEVKNRKSAEAESSETSGSPATAFSKSRGTISSTTSIPNGSRSSTAATSIESHGLGIFQNNDSTTSLPASKPSSPAKLPSESTVDNQEKLQDEPVDHTVHAQNATIEPAKTPGKPLTLPIENVTYRLSQSKSASYIRETSSRSAQVYASTSFRKASPSLPTPPSSVLTDLGGREGKFTTLVSPQLGGSTFPLTPPISDAGDTAIYTEIINPEDRGKATAMGLFSRPQQQFDEKQYSQRQLQMYEGRKSPKSLKQSSTKPASDQVSNDLVARTEIELRTTHAGCEPALTPLTTSPLADQMTNGTSLETSNLEDVEQDSVPEAGSQIHSPRSPRAIHPALRDCVDQPLPVRPLSSRITAGRKVLGDEALETLASISSSENIQSSEPPFPPQDPLIDNSSPAGRTSGLGLSNIIRNHMRHDSDKSSIMPPPSPRFTARNPLEPFVQNSLPFRAAALKHSEKSQKKIMNYNGELKETTLEIPQKPQKVLGQAAAFENVANVNSQRVLGEKSPRIEGGRNWQDELKPKHQRGGSTETQKERDAFNKELAERRRRVQENMKSIVETESRSQSPAHLSVRSPNIPAGTVSALRQKISKAPVNHKPQAEQQPKATIVLSSSNPPINAPAEKTSQDDLWREEEEQMLQDLGRRPKTRTPRTPPLPQTQQNYLQPPPLEPAQPQKSEDARKTRQRSMTLASVKSSKGDRSSSVISGRSKSRNGRYKDDLDKAMDEGTGSIYQAYEDAITPSSAKVSRPSADVDERQPTEHSTSSVLDRARSESQSRNKGSSDSKSGVPIHTTTSSSTESPRPSLNMGPPSSTTSFHETLTAASRPSTPRTTHSVNYPENLTAPNSDSRKKLVNKEMISEPTLVSSTSDASTVGLPAGASLKNGSEFVDAASSRLPVANPRRRRQKTTLTLFAAFSRTDKSASSSNLSMMQHSSGAADENTEERSTFSDEGEKKLIKPRYRLRKINSEGAHMNAKARQQSLIAPPAVPALPTKTNVIAPKIDGEIFCFGAFLAFFVYFH